MNATRIQSPRRVRGSGRGRTSGQGADKHHPIITITVQTSLTINNICNNMRNTTCRVRLDNESKRTSPRQRTRTKTPNSSDDEQLMEEAKDTTLEDAASNARPKKLSYCLREANAVSARSSLPCPKDRKYRQKLENWDPWARELKILSFVFIERARHRSQRRCSSTSVSFSRNGNRQTVN